MPQLTAVEPSAYLSGDDVVDSGHPAVARLAADLRTRHAEDDAFARGAFEHVRDRIRHSFDADDPRVTVTAPEVLREGVGLCYAKAHLLAALLRAGGVPAGLCYQRLTDDGKTFVVHGLVAVHLHGTWHRQDPRGNEPGLDAQFSLDGERLAWPVRPDLGERDHPVIHVRPHPDVLAALRSTDDIRTLRRGGLPSDLHLP
ncbi:transglutaminase superfamily protein [Kineococcus xinjiangensis]|uniref:Transglutaminase superfamily protein n=1 Tax=Kineococcus xinjiangensis TaxID=512762 RepID=A0A2S6IUA8_9ACTN|nr:transglutaminase family protein [Kineococcus xinjiangensis]PPK97760.1 transglutaminase superfamily protein [Kineococcus xinjiangensis]